jgi:hypothetical protein
MLKLTLDRTKPLKPAPWNERALGVYRQQTIYKDRNVQPGDEFSYLSFEPTINLLVNTHVKVKDYEVVELGAGKPQRRLLRVDLQAEKVQQLQLPPYVVWLDDEMNPVRSQFEVPGLGKVLLHRTTRDIAVAPAAGAPALDVGISHYIRLNQRIARPHETKAAVYRVTIKDEDNPAETFAQSTRQEITSVNGSTLELRVHGGVAEQAKQPGPEYTESSYFINSDDQRVKTIANQAVGAESDPWRKARRIERWVHANMRIRAHEALATADHVAKTLEGDCTEFAMLTAALCRAAGIPSRTATGLVYADVRQGPVFAFHMWTEVWIDGQWRALDATLGQGGIGAAHLKIADQSWHEERSLTPLLPVVRVLGKLSIEVVRAEGR